MPFSSSELSSTFPETKNCVELDRQINKLVNNTDFWRKQFNEEQYLEQFQLAYSSVADDEGNFTMI